MNTNINDIESRFTHDTVLYEDSELRAFIEQLNSVHNLINSTIPSQVSAPVWQSGLGFQRKRYSEYAGGFRKKRQSESGGNAGACLKEQESDAAVSDRCDPHLKYAGHAASSRSLP